jgi:phenylacetate-CoA ligase
VLQEVVEPSTGHWVAGGERGELVGTPIISAAEPLFRIRTRDEVRWQAPGCCPCGSSWPGIESGTVRRLDGMMKVKGVNLWPAHVEAALFAVGRLRDYRVRVLLDAQGREVIRLDVLARPGEAGAAGLAERVGGALRDATGLAFEVDVVADEAVWFQETSGEAAKARRWVDARMPRR